MPKLICCKCEIEYKIAKSGAWVMEMFGDPPSPYKIWSADAHECPKCSNLIIAGFGNSPIAEHYQEDFKEVEKKVIESETAKDGWLFFDYEN